MIPKHQAPNTARLSNWLTVQAAEVAGEVARFKREAHTAYVSAGRRLVEVRGACRRGEWGAFLQAAGVEPRTARNMTQLARAGLSAADVTEAGGVQAALDALRAAAAGAVEAAAEAASEREKTEFDSAFSPAADDAPGYPPATGRYRAPGRAGGALRGGGVPPTAP